MTMPKQIDVKVTKTQNKHGQGRTRKCPVITDFFLVVCRAASTQVCPIYLEIYLAYFSKGNRYTPMLIK